MKKLLVLLISLLLPAVAHAADPEATCRKKVASVLPNIRNLVIENETVTVIRDRPADPDSRYFLVDVDFKAGTTEHRRYVCLADRRGNAFLRGVAQPPTEQHPGDDSAAATRTEADEPFGLRR